MCTLQIVQDPRRRHMIFGQVEDPRTFQGILGHVKGSSNISKDPRTFQRIL